MRSSSYFQEIAPLYDLVVGRRVVDSEAGHSGFLLTLSDGRYVLCYLGAGKLRWDRGLCTPIAAGRAMMHSPHYGDGRPPLASDAMYANQVCDIAGEVAKSHGQVIEGLAYGEHTFNFCFPNGRELSTTIGTAQDGKPALRVFWEQW
jgi:hypothetical protein